MRRYSLSELEAPLGATLEGADASFDAVSTDTRSIQRGELFVALRGPSFDGHDFVSAAAERGACAALVSAHAPFPLSVLRVADTQRSLGHLAALGRREYTGKLVGVTGSGGKTTVKNMLAQILQLQGSTLATRGNLNNEIGVPLTLLRLQAEHRYAVIEMGASRAGDIAYLCELARPNVSVLLNALPAHLDGFGDLAGVANAKGEIFAGLGVDGTAVINADSEFAPLWRGIARASRKIEFGFAEDAPVSARNVIDKGIFGSHFTLVLEQQEVEVELALPGLHNIVNALAASAASLALGLAADEIAAGLRRVSAEPGRMQVHRPANGMVLVDDTYNANPAAVEAAIDLLAACAGRRILVLGSMAELGQQSPLLHRRVGRYARERGLDELWLCGRETLDTQEGFGASARYFEDREDLVQSIRGRFGEGDVVLVKGSRSAGMDALVADMLAGDGGQN